MQKIIKLNNINKNSKQSANKSFAATGEVNCENCLACDGGACPYYPKDSTCPLNKECSINK